MECPDGKMRYTYPLLAFHVCDHMEALKVTCTLMHTCTGCAASHGSMQSAYRGFTRKETAKMVEIYTSAKAEFLDDAGMVLEGKGEALRRFENEHFYGCRYIDESD